MTFYNSEVNFTTMLLKTYLIPEFIKSSSKYNIDYLKYRMKEDEINSFVASVIFNNQGELIPFQYKLTEDELNRYNDRKKDI